MEQEQLTFLEHPSSVPVFSGVCVTRSLVLCVCFVDDCLSFCPFLPLCCLSFDLRIIITPFGFGILKLFLRKAVIHFPIGSYVKNCHCRELKHFVAHFSFCFEETLYRTFHRCFLPNICSFGN